MLEYVSYVLEKRVSVDSHQRDHRKRYQRDYSNDHLRRCRHRNQKKLNIPEQHEKYQCLNCVPRGKHTSEQLTGIRVICRYCVNLFFLHNVSFHIIVQIYLKLFFLMILPKNQHTHHMSFHNFYIVYPYLH